MPSSAPLAPPSATPTPSSTLSIIPTSTPNPTPKPIPNTPTPRPVYTPAPTLPQSTTEEVSLEANQTGLDEDVSFSRLWANSSYVQKMWPGHAMSKVSEDDCTPAAHRKAITPYEFSSLGQSSDFVRFEVLEKWEGNKEGRLVLSCASKSWTEEAAKELYKELISMLRQTSVNGLADSEETLVSNFANAYSRSASDTEFTIEIIVQYQPSEPSSLYFYFNGRG